MQVALLWQWLTRLSARFQNDAASVAEAMEHIGGMMAEDALDYGLVSDALDDIDYEDEVRIAIEERLSFSPDALTEWSKIFVSGGESMENKIYTVSHMAKLDIPASQRSRRTRSTHHVRAP